MNVKPASNIVNDPLALQFQNLGLNAGIGQHVINSTENMMHGECTTPPRSNSNRSISDAGLYNLPPPHPITIMRPQTAPANSENTYGFNYPIMYYQYDNSFTNNNVLYQPVGNDHNLRPYVPGSNATGFLRPHSPMYDNGNLTGTSPTRNGRLSPQVLMASNNEGGSPIIRSGTNSPIMTPIIRSGTNSPVLPPRPIIPYQGGVLQFSHIPPGYIFMSPVTPPPMHNPGSTAPRGTPPNLHQLQLTAVSESPEQDNYNTQCENRQTYTTNSMPAPQNQLHINVESNDATSHNWIPLQAGASNLNYPNLPQPYPNLSRPVYHMNPDVNNQSYSTLTRTVDQVAPPNMQFHPPMYWNQASLPVIPVSGYQSPYMGYCQVPTVDVTNNIQTYTNDQKKMLNSLHDELIKQKNDVRQCKNEIKILEEQLTTEKLILPTEEQLEKEIAELRTQCLRLTREVDIFTEEKAVLGDFYSSINTGQQGPLLPDKKQDRKKTPPPRKSITREEDEENSDCNNWPCTECTYRNHSGMAYCELCDRPRKNSAGQVS